MIAAGAKAVIVGPGGRRSVAIRKCRPVQGKLVWPRAADRIVSLPKPAPRTEDAYLRLSTQMDIAVVEVAICVTLSVA